MNIVDIFRGLPFPMQGLLMQAYGATANKDNEEQDQGAGAGRGFVNPAMVNPNGPTPQMPRVASAAPAVMPQGAPRISNPEDPMASPIATAMAPQEPDPVVMPQGAPRISNPDDPMASPIATAMVPQQAAPQPEQPGILSQAGTYLNKQFGFDQPDFLSRLGNGLAVAGSQDPFKALMMLKAQESENAKIKVAQQKANRGETKHIAGALFGVYGPDGTLQRTFVDPTAGKYENDKAARDAEIGLGKTVQSGVIQEMIKKQMATFDDTIKEAGGATSKPEYSTDVARQVAKLDGIIAKIPAMNTVDVPGMGPVESPALASLRDNTYGRVANTEEYKTRRDLQAYYTKDVLADVKKLGANPSNADREFIAKPIPKADDPIAYQVEYAQEMRNRLHEAETRRVAAAQQRDAAAGSSVVAGSRAAPAASAPAAAAPAAAANTPVPSAMKTQATTAFGAYEPDKYEYGINPATGKFARRPKGN